MGITNPLDAFSKLYAVVLDHDRGGGMRVKWSLEHTAWIRNRDYSRDGWRQSPDTAGTVDVPTDDDRVLALALATGAAQAWCQRCGLTDPHMHFIAPNIYGEPTLYCVQAPCPEVVNSKGGGGRVKHWGSPFGCQAVDYIIDSDGGPASPHIGPVALHIFGQPLVAEDVIDRPWCSRCTGSAFNVRVNTSHDNASSLEQLQNRIKVQVRYAARRLGDYYGED